MSKHTPGPWEWVTRGKSIYLATPDHGHLIVMDFVRMGFNGGTFRLASWGGDERENMGGIMRPAHELGIASHPDARLIAAAPDLLEACKAAMAYIPGSEVRSWPPGFQLRDAALKSLKAAIAKAEGVQQ